MIFRDIERFNGDTLICNFRPKWSHVRLRLSSCLQRHRWQVLRRGLLHIEFGWHAFGSAGALRGRCDHT
jgi:hypothetical protein